MTEEMTDRRGVASLVEEHLTPLILQLHHFFREGLASDLNLNFIYLDNSETIKMILLCSATTGLLTLT
jgi:hypothetical protein